MVERDRTSAIPEDDKLLDKSLSELSAAQLIDVLNRGDALGQGSLALLPDKKKYELWVEEGGFVKIPLRELLRRLRAEKKKIELEKFKIEIDLKRSMEFDFDPTRRLIDPRIIDEIATQVAAKLRG